MNNFKDWIFNFFKRKFLNNSSDFKVNDLMYEYVKNNNTKSNEISLKNTKWIINPVTKFWGIPFWPKGLDRPICNKWHNLSFIMQINTDDVFDFQDGNLVSFHYCEECTMEWDMSWWYLDEDNTNRYKISIFKDVNKIEKDSLWIVSKTTPIDELWVELKQIIDVPCYEDINDYCINNKYDDEIKDKFFELTNFLDWEDVFIDKRFEWYIHSWETKLWWYPSWWQTPEYFENTNMKFICQISWDLWDTAWQTWAAYLFVDMKSSIWELVIQTT